MKGSYSIVWTSSLPSECGTYKKVKAIVFRQNSLNRFELFPFRSESVKPHPPSRRDCSLSLSLSLYLSRSLSRSLALSRCIALSLILSFALSCRRDCSRCRPCPRKRTASRSRRLWRGFMTRTGPCAARRLSLQVMSPKLFRKLTIFKGS